jgi:hypothetical protein
MPATGQIAAPTYAAEPMPPSLYCRAQADTRQIAEQTSGEVSTHARTNIFLFRPDLPRAAEACIRLSCK